MTDKLKPCPFCGGNVSVEEIQTAEGVCFKPCCNTCGDDSGYVSFRSLWALKNYWDIIANYYGGKDGD